MQTAVGLFQAFAWIHVLRWFCKHFSGLGHGVVVTEPPLSLVTTGNVHSFSIRPIHGLERVTRSLDSQEETLAVSPH